MCLFKKKDFKEANTLNSLVGAGIFAIILAIVLPFITAPNENLASKFALAQLSLSSVGFILIIATLCFTIVQLRKSMAKPRLEVIFTKTNNNEYTINILPKKDDKQYLRLSVINKGNAITDMFQIDFDIPVIFNPTINSNKPDSVHHHANGSNRIVSFVSNHDHPCFVNTPTPIYSLVLETHEKEYEKYSSRLVIPYKIFGDWSQAHEGKLKITCNKKYKEVT